MPKALAYIAGFMLVYFAAKYFAEIRADQLINRANIAQGAPSQPNPISRPSANSQPSSVTLQEELDAYAGGLQETFNTHAANSNSAPVRVRVVGRRLKLVYSISGWPLDYTRKTEVTWRESRLEAFRGSICRGPMKNRLLARGVQFEYIAQFLDLNRSSVAVFGINDC